MMHIDGSEPEQGVLFDEDKRKQEVEKLDSQIRHHSKIVEEKLESAKAIMTLLKDGPKAIHEIFFECKRHKLAIDHLELLSERSHELGEAFVEAAKACALVGMWEQEKKELTGETIIVNGYEGSTAEEAEDAAIDAEVSEIYDSEPAQSEESNGPI